jgi:hypothetical protein
MTTTKVRNAARYPQAPYASLRSESIPLHDRSRGRATPDDRALPVPSLIRTEETFYASRRCRQDDLRAGLRYHGFRQPGICAGVYGPAPSPWAICDVGADEGVASAMTLEPANVVTIPAGTPVTLSGKTGQALTFSVASSEALLSSPDIDSGIGSESGAFYEFTSTKATAMPRTIYWTASFTLTPNECERPYTFTSPVHTLVVVPSEAELAAANKQQEQAAARKKLEEEDAAKKKEEAAAAGTVVLDGLAIEVLSGREAAVKLTCSDVATCAGKLTLAVSEANKGKGRRAKTDSIGTASFSIAAGDGATIELTIDKTGHALLTAARGHLNATLTIIRTAPLPSKTQTQRVHLAQQKTAKQRGGS